MPRKKIFPRPRSEGSPNNTPTQDDENDILQEAEAETDENGQTVVSEEKIRELGAVDAESVRENRRSQDVVNKKKGNVPKVAFNTNDPIAIYDMVLRTWGANSVEVIVKRLTGGPPVTHVIQSRPRSGVELYAAIQQQVHGFSPEAEYEVKVIDSSRKEYRGTGRIVMPDTRPPGQQQQGQPPMNTYNPYAPNGYPPGGAPQSTPYTPHPTGGFPPNFTPSQQTPVVVPAPAPAPATGFDLSSFQQMFEMFQAWQRQMQPPPAPGAPPTPPMDPAMFREMLAMWMQMQQMQQQPQQSAPAQAPAPAPAPPVSQISQVQPLLTLVRELKQLSQALGIEEARHAPAPAPMYRRAYEDAPPPPRHVPPPPPPMTPAQQFRDSISFLRSASDALEEFRSMIPGGEAPERTHAPTSDDDDSPVRVIETGAAKILVNKKDGSLRPMETAWANMDKILKWSGEQIDNVNRARERRENVRVQLPAGYVEMTPGYQPPPGMVAVPVDQSQLPPPPTEMPPPIRQHPQQASWGAPPETQE